MTTNAIPNSSFQPSSPLTGRLAPIANSVSRAREQLLQDSMKKKELKPVDHSKISYINIRKNLYIIPKALATAPAEKVSEDDKALSS